MGNTNNNGIKQLKLTYFDIPGKGEAIRLACRHAAIPLEDHRIAHTDFPALKPTLAFGQLPVLTITFADGRTSSISQSNAILRFIGRLKPEANLYPTDLVQAALVDALLDQEADMMAALTVSRYKDRFGFGSIEQEQIAVVRKALNDEVLPRHLSFFEALLVKSTSGWLAGGENPTIADFVVSTRLTWLVSGQNDGISNSLLEAYPHVVALLAKVKSLSSVTSYYAEREAASKK